MKLLKSKSGFTLIELLVVIGILAVLAAIAIPSVAGLIDRANKSADQTNANEMTNAIERFTSEYELVKQDIASNTLDKHSLDAAQGRVISVLNINNQKEITLVESGNGLAGYGISRNTNYPINEKTVKAVITNYMKTSSDTFIPKQSDNSFFYSPELGKVIVAETGTASNELDKIANMNAETTMSVLPEGESLQWIDLSINARLSANHQAPTSSNVALDTNTYTELRSDVISASTVESISGGLFEPGTQIYKKINVGNEIVDATWSNLILGDYIRYEDGKFSNGKNVSKMTGELVFGGENPNIINYYFGDNSQFLNGAQIESIVLKNGIAGIGAQCFSRAYSVKRLSIPESVKTIGNGLLMLAKNLEKIEVAESNPYFTSVDGILFSKSLTVLYKYPAAKSTTTYYIPETVTSLRPFAFHSCLIENIYFNESLTIMGTQIFELSTVKNVYINDKCELKEGDANFRSCHNVVFHINETNRRLKCIDNVLYSYDLKKIISTGYQADKTVEIPDTVTQIHSIYVSSVKTLIIPTSVKIVKPASIYVKLDTILYKGTEEQFKQIQLESGLDEQETYRNWTNANVVYNYTP